MQAASRRNEGKIHLGFVYALDQSSVTPRRMLEGALTFGPLLDTWCGPLPWNSLRSEGFRYAVMPDSLADPAELVEAYEKLRGLLPEAVAACPVEPRYIGRSLDWLWRHTNDARGRPVINGAAVKMMIETEEVSVNPIVLADKLAQVVSRHAAIDLRCGTTVRSAERRADGFRLWVEDGSEISSFDAEAVVNCTWVDRERLDRTVGVEAVGEQTSYRVKHQILVKLPNRLERLAPVTLVQGPYGDVVPWNDGLVYVSWYPESRSYFGRNPPPYELDNLDRNAEIAQRSLAAIANLFPDLKGAEIVSSLAGVIVAPGATDIDDPASTLHKRSSFGIQEFDGWWSIDTGKLTTAPLLGEKAAASVAERMGHEIA
jgi:hypothetical protein